MTKRAKMIAETEWSHFWDLQSWKGKKQQITLSPDKEESQRLCQRLGLKSLKMLKAEITIERGTGEAAFHISGQITADIVQSCVVTLEPVKNHIEDTFEAWFADPESAVSIAKARQDKESEKGRGEVPMLEEYEDPEPIIDGKIDLGELVTQYLSLSIDPYPHAEGVESEDDEETRVVHKDETINNPFAALKSWKDRMSGDNGE